MNKPLLALIPAARFAVFAFSVLAPLAAQPAAGYWEGTARIMGTTAAIEVTLVQGPGDDLQGAISVPSQDIVDRKLEGIAISGPEISCRISGVPGSPTIRGRIEGGTLKGNLSQGGYSIAFELRRIGDAKPAPKNANGPGPQSATADGFWEGAIHIPGTGPDLQIQVNLIKGNESGYRGYVSVPSQGIMDEKLEALAVAPPEISFRLPKAGGDPTCAGRIEGDAIKGDFTQGGFKTTFELKRTGDARPIAEAAIPEGLAERAIAVGSPPWELPGTLTLPKGKGPFPAAILVHGSGPSDRDESIGACRTFRDISWGLAEKGVAVLRYDKRTFVHGAKMADSATLYEETVEDAALAVGLAAGLEEVDAGKIFVIGHSLGGYALGRIAEKAPRAAGFVSLAGAARPMWDTLVEQLTYLASAQGADEETAKKAIDRAKAAVAKIKSDELSTETPAAELYGVPGAYWLDMRGYDPVAALGRAKRPALILQGEADYQVTMEDFALWKSGLPEATFKSFPKLNHHFMFVEGKSTGLEYFNPGMKVDPGAIQAMAEWILGLGGGSGSGG